MLGKQPGLRSPLLRPSSKAHPQRMQVESPCRSNHIQADRPLHVRGLLPSNMPGQFHDDLENSLPQSILRSQPYGAFCIDHFFTSPVSCRQCACLPPRSSNSQYPAWWRLGRVSDEGWRPCCPFQRFYMAEYSRSQKSVVLEGAMESD